MTHETTDGNLSVRLKGRCTFADYESFQLLFDGFAKGGTGQVQVDLSQLEFIDSSGVGMLLLLSEKCDQYRKRLLLKSPAGQVRKMFEVAKLGDLLSVHY